MKKNITTHNGKTNTVCDKRLKSISQKDTRQRLLESATEIFAKKGFRDTTIAEVCKKAQANVAAVNYHFGDKKKLYEQTWRYANHLANEQYPLNCNLPENASPQDKLRCFISAMLHRVLADSSAKYLPALKIKEMAEPTESFPVIFPAIIQPQIQYVCNIVKAILGKETIDHDVRLCAMSVASQCLFFAFNKALRDKILSHGGSLEDKIAHLTEHINNFSLDGLKRLLEQQEDNI